MCVAPDPSDPLSIRIQQEWEEVSTVADGILRGPVDHLLREPERARCRLCGQSLTGNLVVDQNIVGNNRLVQCMDFAWSVCERFCRDKGEMQRRALAKRRHLEEVQGLAGALRAELPSQVHGYVMRTLNEPREKLCKLRQQLEDLNAIDGLGLGWAQKDVTQTEIDEAAASQPLDMLWYRFRESMERRVARLAVQGSGDATASAPSSPAKESFSPPRSTQKLPSASPAPVSRLAADQWSNYVVPSGDKISDGMSDVLFQPQAPAIPISRVGIDRSGDGRSNYVVNGPGRSGDGIPDLLQRPQAPISRVGIDTSGDGRPNYVVTGMDRNRDGIDGIPDLMQQPSSMQPLR